MLEPVPVQSHDRRKSIVAGLFAAAALLGAAACGHNNHVGRPCDIGVDTSAQGGTTGSNGIVNPSALECPSRVCLLPSEQKTSSGTGAFCTADCASDDDCADGEHRDKSDSNDHRCNSGFACRRLFPGLANNPLAYKTICVCKDFLLDDTVGKGEQPGCNGNNRI